MKKTVCLTAGLLTTLLCCTPAAAATGVGTSGVPLWLCIPFAGLLLSIAVFPLVKPEWWDKNKGKAVIFWSLLFVVPFAFTNGIGESATVTLECLINDYLTFIVLLFGLFCVSGNITLEGDLVGSPRVNVLILALGTLLSSCIGTTGASMAEHPESLLHTAALLEDGVSGRTAFDAAELGDESAKAVVRRYEHGLSVGIANIINIFFPEVIGLSGGVANQGEKLLVPLRAEVESMFQTRRHRRVSSRFPWPTRRTRVRWGRPFPEP